MIINNQKSMLYVALCFVVLYGSGFVGAKLGFPYVNPLVFLVIRFFISTLIFLAIALLVKAKWPRSFIQVIHISVAGLLLVGLFSIGTWVSIDLGITPSTSALIIALQPLTVAIGAYFLFKHKIKPAIWVGLLLGLIGVVMVVIEHAQFNHTYAVGILMSFIGLLGLSIGSLYQKHFCKELNIFTAGVIQSFTSGIVCILLCYFYNEPFVINWSEQFVFSLIWMCFIVSFGAISCLYILILNGESSKVASLFYLVPIVTTIISFLVFNTKLDTIQVCGILIATLGVGLVHVNFKKVATLFLKFN